MITLHHIPVCPFSQRLEILLAFKGCPDHVQFSLVDITRPRPEALLAMSGGSTALPLLVAGDGTALRESLVILRYLDEVLPGPPLAHPNPLRHAVESLLAAQERDFGEAGYRLLMNRDVTRRDALQEALLAQYARLDELLCRHGSDGPWLQQQFGWAEVVYAPLFVRFHFLDYYEDFQLPTSPRYARVAAWQSACLAHPLAQQVSREEVIKLYFDYALGVGNGAVPPDRTRSSFALQPRWSERPWPPRDKFGLPVDDMRLGLL